MNNNLNNDLFINPTKLFTNKIWNENIIKNYDQGLNNLNSSFNENLILKPKTITEYDIGRSYDNYFKKEYFGIKSLKKITNIDKYNNTADNIFINELNNINSLQFKQNPNKYNEIISTSLYKYSLDLSENDLNIDILDNNTEFVIDYHNSEYKNEDPVIENPKVLNNTLIFYSDKIIKNPQFLSLIVKKNHTITKFKDYGTIYSCILNDNLNITDKFNDKKNIKLYYNTFPIEIINYNDSTNNIQFISNDTIELELNDFIKVEQQVGLEYFTIIDYSGNNVSKLNFIGNDPSSFYDASLNNYININYIDYKIYYNIDDDYYYINEDITSTFDLTTVLNKKIITNKLYNIFKFSYISTINDSIYKYFEIEIDTPLNTLNHGDNNYSIKNITNTLSNFTLINSSKLGIYYNVSNTIGNLVNYILIHSYNFNESNNYIVKAITNSNIYMYNINEYFTVYDKDNTYLKLYDGTYDNFDTSGNYYSYTSNIVFNENNLIQFTNDIKNDETTLNTYGVNVIKVSNLTDIKKVLYKNGRIQIHLQLPTGFWTNSYITVTSIDYNDITNITDGVYITNSDYNLELSKIVLKYNDNEIYNDITDGLNGSFYVYNYNSISYLYFETDSIELSSFYSNLFTIDYLQFTQTFYSSKEYLIGNINDFENVDTSGNYIYIPDQSGNIFFTDIYSKINQTSYDYYLMYDGSGEQTFIKLDIANIYYNNQLVIEMTDTHSILDTNYYLFLKLKDIDINKEIYHYMYNIETNDNIVEHNINDYFVPQLKLYDSDIKEITYKNEYRCNISDVDGSDSDLINTIDTLNFINVKVNNKLELCQVVVLYKDASDSDLIDYELVIGTNANILENTNYQVYSLDYTFNDILTFTKNSFMYNDAKFQKYNSKTDFNIFVRNEFVSSVYTKDSSSNIINLTDFNYYVNFKNQELILKNESYNDVGMKKIDDIYTDTVSEVTNTFDAKWDADTGVKLFNTIEFIIDNEVVEKLDHHVYKILYNYNYTIYKEGMFKMLNGLKYNNDNNLYFYVPLNFFFSTNSAVLPVCAMKNSNIKIKFYANKLENLVTNYSSNYTITKKVKPEMDIYYETIHLDNELVKKFSEKHYYLAQVSNIYSTKYLTELNNNIHLNINALVKDIFFVVDGNNTIKSVERDNIYTNYLSDYNDFINGASKVYSENYKLFTRINNEIVDGSIRINTIENNNILSNYDIKFILYIDEKYLNYIDEDLNNIATSYSNKITILTLYFLKNYKNKTNYKLDNGIINNINIKLNGHHLINDSGKYFNSVLPYMKGYRLLDNYYVYSFGYDSKAKQPNGYLNMSKIEDIYVNTTIDNTDSIKTLNTYTREYKILSIENKKCKVLKT